MKTFEDFMYEATETGINSGGSRASELEEALKLNRAMLKEIASKDYKLLLYGKSMYFLTDKSYEYLGHIEIRDNIIRNSFSNISKGFYYIMFDLILRHTNLKEILLDVRLSTQAIGSYEKLYKITYLTYR